MSSLIVSKYYIPSCPSYRIGLPSEGKVLSVEALYSGQIVLHLLHKTEAQFTQRVFSVYQAGQKISPESKHYVGTATVNQVSFYVFEDEIP
jgi:hypothetical protein